MKKSKDENIVGSLYELPYDAILVTGA